MIDESKMLDCCKECEFDCKRNQWHFDSVANMSGCLLADIEMMKIKESEDTE